MLLHRFQFQIVLELACCNWFQASCFLNSYLFENWKALWTWYSRVFLWCPNIYDPASNCQINGLLLASTLPLFPLVSESLIIVPLLEFAIQIAISLWTLFYCKPFATSFLLISAILFVSCISVTNSVAFFGCVCTFQKNCRDLLKITSRLILVCYLRSCEYLLLFLQEGWRGVSKYVPTITIGILKYACYLFSGGAVQNGREIILQVNCEGGEKTWLFLVQMKIFSSYFGEVILYNPYIQRIKFELMMDHSIIL